MTSRGINNPDQTLLKHHFLWRGSLDDRLESQGRAPVFQCVTDGLKDIRVPFRHRSAQWVRKILVHLDVCAFA